MIFLLALAAGYKKLEKRLDEMLMNAEIDASIFEMSQRAMPLEVENRDLKVSLERLKAEVVRLGKQRDMLRNGNQNLERINRELMGRQLLGLELCEEGCGYITVRGARAHHLSEEDATCLYNIIHLELGPREAPSHLDLRLKEAMVKDP